MKLENAEKFAQDWIKAWNSHDLNLILDHYADDIEISTPMIKHTLGIKSGSMKGKKSVREYWEKALIKYPNLHFQLHEITTGINSIALYYTSILDKKAIEVMFFNDENKVSKMFAYYN